MPTPPIIGHVAFRVRDMERSVAWYAAAFGAREAFRATDDDGKVLLIYIELAPGQFIEFFPDGRNPIVAPDKPLGYVHTCLVVDDVAATLDHLATLGIMPSAPLRTGRAGQQLAFIDDPDGNRLELMAIPPDSPIYRAV
jgi:lactoylglutathione lyase